MSTDQKTIKQYDDYAEKWAAHMRSGKNIAHEYLEKPAMYGKLPDVKGLKILCLGCGTGEECERLAALGAEVVGVDISSGLIEVAKKSYPNLDFQVMDVEAMDFSDGQFDFVYSSLVMHYLASWQKALAEIYRVLKPGGRFLFSTHHPTVWGADRSRGEVERITLLGYRKQIKENTWEVVGDYFTARQVEDLWFGGEFKVSFYHRSLADIFSDIKQSGFIVADILEPRPIEKAKDIDPQFYDIHLKIPLFIIFELKK